MDGSTFSGMIEVTQDQFRGSLAMPLLSKPSMGFDYEFSGDDTMPAGTRCDWKDSFSGPVKACRIVTPAGPRFFLSAAVPIKSHAEAMAELQASLANAAQAVIAQERADERRLADARGMTLEQYRAYKRRKDLEDRFDAARRRHEDEERAIFNLPSDERFPRGAKL